MSSATEYTSVPTTTTTRTTSRRRTEHSGVIVIAILCIAFGIPLIVYGVLEYKKVSNFSRQPNYCRVNGVDTQREIRKQLSKVNPVWSVDIIKQSDSSNPTKDLVVLRSDLKITGSNGHVFSSSALEEAKQLYSAGKIYPCYHHKQLLRDAAADNREINLKHAIQWEKPSRKSAFVLLSIGSALPVIGIIILFIVILFYYRR